MKTYKDLYMKYKIECLIILIGFLFYIVLSATSSDIGMDKLIRPGYEEADENREIIVEGLAESDVKLEVPVSHRHYQQEEFQQISDVAVEELKHIMLGGNASLNEVERGLNLVGAMEEYGISVDWDVDDDILIDVEGNVYNAALTEPKQTYIKANLSYENYEQSYIIELRIIPRLNYSMQDRIDDFSAELGRLDSESLENESYMLPESFDGRELSYREEDGVNPHLIWIMGVVFALFYNVSKKRRTDDRLKHMQQEAAIDYSDIVSKLLIYIGAGLSVRSAWEALVRDYEHSSHKKRFAYEEMAKSLTGLKSGVSEMEVYREFGRRMKSSEYMKLASLLEQNRKTGLYNLRDLLLQESMQAWELRLNNAKRLGEEASTKLLLPMLMSLVLVLIVVITPAMMSF